MGAFAVDHFGVAGEDRFDDLGVTEHSVDKEVSPGTLGNEVVGDFAVSNVSGGSNCGFKIAICPIPDGIEKGGVLGEEFLDFVELTMRNADEFLDEVSGKGGFAVLGFGGAGKSEVWHSDYGSGCGDDQVASRKGFLHCVSVWVSAV